MKSYRFFVLLAFFLSVPQSLAHKQLAVTGVDPGSYVTSNLVCWNTEDVPGDNVTIYTVPNGKTFVMTDLLSTGSAQGAIVDDGAYIFRFDPNLPVHMVTGIRFGENSTITVDGDDPSEGCLTLSGYLY